MRRTILATLGILILGFTFSSMASAQDVRQRRREFVEDLLKNLIESQMDRHDDRGHQAHPGGGRVVPPGQPGRFPIQPQPPRQPVQVTPGMIKCRKHLQGMNDETEHLIYDLRKYESTHPEIRPLLGDAIKIRASVDVLSRRCAVVPDVAIVRQDIMALDRDWRMLNHRMSQVRGIHSDCTACAAKIHRYQEQLCECAGIQPQFNRVELARLVTTINSELSHLLRDVYYEMQTHPELPRLLRRGKTLQAQINQCSPLINHGNYEQIVTAFKGCNDSWRKFNRELCKYPNDRTRHCISEIEEAGRQIHEVLWLPIALDREYYCQLCSGIDTDLDRLFKHITLEDMMNCKTPGSILTSAREFRRRCSGFGTSLESGAVLDDLNWEYRSFDNQWRTFREHCSMIQKPVIVRRLDEIEHQMSMIRPTFGTGPLISHGQLVRMCAELDQWVHELHDEIHQIQGRQYGMYREFCGCCDKMQNTCHELHERILGSRNPKMYRAQLDACFQEWTRLKGFMNQCKEVDRRRFARMRSQIEPIMVKLQVIYSS